MRSIEASKCRPNKFNATNPRISQLHMNTTNIYVIYVSYMSYMSHRKTLESLTRNEAVNPKTILSCGITAAQQSVQGG